MLQALYHLLVHRTLLEVDAYIGTGGIAETLGIHIETTARDDIGIDQMLHTLMDRCTRHITLGGYILEWNTRILRQNAQYFLVQKIYFFHFYSRLVTFCQQK